MPSNYEQENTLLKALKAGKTRAFTQFCQENKYWMFLEAYGYLDNEPAAQDLIQELLIDFWEYKLYKNIAVNLKGYIIVMIRNRSANYLRKQARQQKQLYKYVNVHELVMPDIDLQKGELGRRLDNAIAALPARIRQAFIHCYIDQLSHQETANLMGVSRTTVRSQLARAIKLLRKDLKKIASD